MCWISEQNISWYWEHLFWLLLSRVVCVVPWCHASMSSLASRFSWDVWFSVGAGAGARETPKKPFHMSPDLIIQGQFNIAPQAESQLPPTCPAEKLLPFFTINQLTLTTIRFEKNFNAPGNWAMDHDQSCPVTPSRTQVSSYQILSGWTMFII